MTTSAETDGAADRIVAELAGRQRWVAFAALLAQVEDVHVGGIWSFGQPEQDTAAAMFDELERSGQRDPATEALLMSLAVPVHDIDHPALTSAQDAAAVRMLNALRPEFA